MTQPKRSKFSINRSLARKAFAEFRRRHGETVPERKLTGAALRLTRNFQRRVNEYDYRAGIQGEGHDC